MKTLMDNTLAGARAFFPVGIGMPQVAYAPEDGNAQGGGAGTASDDSDGGDETVDTNRDLDDPAADMYPEEAKKKQGDTSDNADTQNDDGAQKNKPGQEDESGADDDDDADDDDSKEDDDKEGDDKEGDEEKDDDKEVDLTTVPEDGKYKLTMPEGIEVDQDLLDQMSPIWKEKGMTHKDAQDLTDKYVEQRMKEADAAQTSWKDTTDGWAEETKTDKEIGGEQFKGNLQIAKNTLEKFGNPKLMDALTNSGMGSHPEIIRMLVKVGNSMSDDDIPTPNGETQATVANSNAEIAAELYGDDTPTTKR